VRRKIASWRPSFSKGKNNEPCYESHHDDQAQPLGQNGVRCGVGFVHACIFLALKDKKSLLVVTVFSKAVGSSQGLFAGRQSLAD
jgi:hypothetical protein